MIALLQAHALDRQNLQGRAVNLSTGLALQEGQTAGVIGMVVRD
jgi:hypothetical protein